MNKNNDKSNECVVVEQIDFSSGVFTEKNFMDLVFMELFNGGAFDKTQLVSIECPIKMAMKVGLFCYCVHSASGYNAITHAGLTVELVPRRGLTDWRIAQ